MCKGNGAQPFPEAPEPASRRTDGIRSRDLGPLTLIPAWTDDLVMEDVMGRPRDFTRDECLALMHTVRIGRVVFTEQALPAVMPVAFVIDDGDVVICVPPESNLSAVTRGAIVAFEVDDLDAAAPAGWAITVIGRARVDRDPGERVRQALHAWAMGPHTEFIRISCQRLAGRRIWPSHIGEDHAAA